MEQTHAIQDKVDEVATAVEEIGNSMTLTLKALAEGKQDIDVYKRQHPGKLL